MKRCVHPAVFTVALRFSVPVLPGYLAIGAAAIAAGLVDFLLNILTH